MKVLLAAFYTPGIRGIEYLMQAGFQPHQIHLITHDIDRNQPLLSFASTNKIETRTFSVRSSAAYRWIREFQPDIVFSLYFRHIIPQAVLEIPPLGAINLHPALLPKYRGAFSTPWAIINGENVTGFTYHYMLPEVDAGNIILQAKIPIRSNDTAYSLYHRLIVKGLAVFGEVFRLVVERRYPGKPQLGGSSYYPRGVPYDGYIDPSWSRQQIERFIRAMYFPPFKGACVKLVGGTEQEILSITEYDSLVASGKIKTWEKKDERGG